LKIQISLHRSSSNNRTTYLRWLPNGRSDLLESKSVCSGQ